MLEINWWLIATRPRHQPVIFTVTDTLKEVVHTAVKQPWQVSNFQGLFYVFLWYFPVVDF